MDLLRQEGPKALFAGVLPALVLVIGYMRSALDGDIWIGEAGGHNLSQCAQVERILRRH
jgi:hypothetical protein